MVNIAFSFPYNMFSKLIIMLFTFIDGIFYQLFTIVTWGFTAVMNTTLISNDQIQLIINRFYVIIGIYMLFRFALMLINSIIEPDKFTDKNAGLSKIISRVIITLMMLMFVPSLFTYALDVQNDILATIPKIILGRGNTMTSDDNYQTASDLALTTWSAFIIPNDGCIDHESKDGITSIEDGTIQMDMIYQFATEKCTYSNTGYPVFRYTYWFLVPTVVAIFMVIVMLVYTVSVATRLFKLAVLQILSPIAIISYIDPKADKSGPFNSWLKLTIKTYLEIFIKMATVYFVLALLNSALEGISTEGLIVGTLSAVSVKLYITLFLIIGAFAFMFGANKFINQALGMKDSGKGVFSNLIGKMGAVGVSAAGSLFQSGRLSIGDAKGMDAVKAFGKGMINKNALVNGLKSGVVHGLTSGDKLDLMSSLTAGRNSYLQAYTGDPNAKAKSIQEILRDQMIRNNLKGKGIDKTGITRAESNLKAKQHDAIGRDRLYDYYKSLSTAKTKGNDLQKQLLYYQHKKQNASFGSAEYNEAVSNITRLDAELNGNQETIRALNKNIDTLQNDSSYNWDWNGADANIKYDSVNDTSETLDAKMVLLDDDRRDRNIVNADFEKRLDEAKSLQKSTDSSFVGKPMKDFSKLASTNINDIDSRNKNNNG